MEKNFDIKKVLVIIGGFLLMFNYGMYVGCLGYFTVPVTEELGITRAAYTSINTIQMVVSVVITPILFRTLIPKIGHVKFILISAVICALSYVGFSISNSLAALYSLAVMLGLTYLAQTTISMTNAIQKWFPKNNGTPTGICFAGASTAQIVASIVLPTFIHNNGWRAGYRLEAISCLILAVIGGILVNIKYNGNEVPADTMADKDSGPVEQTGMTLKEAIHHPYFYTFMVASFIASFMCNFNSQLPAFLSDLGVSVVLVSVIMSMVSTSNTIGKVVEGTLCDLIGKRITIALAMGSFAVAFLLFKTGAVPILYIAAVTYGLGMSTATVFGPLVAKDAFGAKDFASIFAIINGSSLLGGAVGGPVWGLVFDLTGSYTLGIIAAPILIVIAALLWIQMSKPKAKKHAEA